MLHRNLLLPCNFLPPDGLEDKDRSMPEKKKIANIKSENQNRVTAPSDNESDDKIGYKGLTPVEILCSIHPTVNNDPDIPNIAEEDSAFHSYSFVGYNK